MSQAELQERFALVKEVMRRTAEPLHIPLGFDFQPMDGKAWLDDWAELAARAREQPQAHPATLYVHVPFCARVCTYCLLSAVRTPGKAAVSDYVRALRRQIAQLAPVVAGLRFQSLHLGGGTPTLLDEGELDTLFTDLKSFALVEGAQIGVEAHPATSTLGRLEVLKAHGVHRLSFGIESFTPAVLSAVNRADQTEARVRTAVEHARRLGFQVNFDLLAGLPNETDASWERTVDLALELAPDSLSVNRFLGENSVLGRAGYVPSEGDNRRADAMLKRADERIREIAPPRWPEEPLGAPAFGTQYVWDPSPSARRYFQSDMVGPVSTLALGHGALGHVVGKHHAIAAKSIEDWVATLLSGQTPPVLASPVDLRFEQAFFVADEATRGKLSAAAFTRVFSRSLTATFGAELTFLGRLGLLTARGEWIVKPTDASWTAAHLVAFLVRDAASLRADLQRLKPRSSPVDLQSISLRRGQGVQALLSGAPATLRLDVGAGIDADAATELAAGARKKLRLEVHGEPDRDLLQYAAMGADMPPSMLWVRLAIRASQASRGEQRSA